MLQFARALALVALLSLVLTSAAVPASTLASTANARQSSSVSGNCCSPSQVARAEARLPAHPLNPQALVHSVTHLKLVRVQIDANESNVSVHRPNNYDTIQYFFGFIPPATGSLFVHRRPRFVVVTEIVEQRKPSGIWITPVLSGIQVHPIPAGYYSPLVLVSPLPQRRLTFIVESNIPRHRLYLLGQLLLTKARATVTNNLGPSHPGAHSPWSIKRVLTVQGVANLCSHHAASRFTASVRGYLAIGSINRLGGGFVGRLFTEPNPHAFFASDTKPFVQVWETKAWHPLPSGRHVTFHGILSCDISGYGASLPGWLGSIKPDRYTTG